MKKLMAFSILFLMIGVTAQVKAVEADPSRSLAKAPRVHGGADPAAPVEPDASVGQQPSNPVGKSVPHPIPYEQIPEQYKAVVPPCDLEQGAGSFSAFPGTGEVR